MLFTSRIFWVLFLIWVCGYSDGKEKDVWLIWGSALRVDELAYRVWVKATLRGGDEWRTKSKEGHDRGVKKKEGG